MRIGAYVLVVLVIAVGSACGSPQGDPQPGESMQPAPPIEAIDEPVPDLWPAGEVSVSIPFPPEDSDFTTEDLSPASGTVPHAIARLNPSRDGGPTARIVVWRTESASLCVEPEAKDTGGWTRAGITGPCTNHCDQICLEQIALGERPLESSALVGVVAAAADELLISFEDGKAQRFPLTAPLVPGFSDWRVFMVDLGDGLYAELELRRAGKRIASVTVPPDEVAIAACFRDELRSAPNRTAKEIAQICARAVPTVK